MAERFGGKYSPDAQKPAQAGRRAKKKRRTRAGSRVNITFVAPIPLVMTGFTKEPTGLAINLAAFGILVLAAWLTREGLIAQDAYEARRVAKRPAFPRKTFGSVLTGIGIFVAGFLGGGALLAACFGAIAGVLHFLAFGPDPMRDKGVDGVDSFQQDRVARAVDEAEAHLDAMRQSIRRAGNRTIEARVDAFQDVVREMFRTVEEDPRDLTSARRYLGVYLLGARDATAKFADIYARTGDEGARADYEALLVDLENNFAAKTKSFLQDDRTDLDVEIEVLRDRLAREGVQTPDG